MRLLDIEKYLSGTELQIGGFDLLYKEKVSEFAPITHHFCFKRCNYEYTKMFNIILGS